MVELSRYAMPDAYVLQEMLLLYGAANSRKRIELLADWYKESNWSRLPFDLAKLAVEDPDQSVRHWIARNGQNLDYRPWDREKRQTDNSCPELDLEGRLRMDSVPLVRAAVLENPRLFDPDRGWAHDLFLREFDAMSELDRLACVRNPRMSVMRINRIAQIGLPLAELQALVVATASKPNFVGHQSSRVDDDFAKLWDTIGSFDFEARRWLYPRIFAPSEKKAEVYQKSEEPYVRLWILEGCDWFVDESALLLGCDDIDDGCREYAHAKLGLWTVNKRLETVLSGRDRPSIRGLYSNPKVTLAQLALIDARWVECRGGQLDPEREDPETPFELWNLTPSLQSSLGDNRAKVAKLLNEKSAWRGTSLRHRFVSSTWAPPALGGTFVFLASIGVLFDCPPDQRTLRSIGIITCCLAIWLVSIWPLYTLTSDVNVFRQFGELKRLLGAKDIDSDERVIRELAEVITLRNGRSVILGCFLLATCIAALISLVI